MRVELFSYHELKSLMTHADNALLLKHDLRLDDHDLSVLTLVQRPPGHSFDHYRTILSQAFSDIRFSILRPEINLFINTLLVDSGRACRVAAAGLTHSFKAMACNNYRVQDRMGIPYVETNSGHAIYTSIPDLDVDRFSALELKQFEAKSVFGGRFEVEHPLLSSEVSIDSLNATLRGYYAEHMPIDTVAVSDIITELDSYCDQSQSLFDIVGVKHPGLPIYHFVLKWFSADNMTLRSLSLGAGFDKLRCLNHAWSLCLQRPALDALMGCIKDFEFLSPMDSSLVMRHYNKTFPRRMLDPLTELMKDKWLLSEQADLCGRIIGHSGFMQIPSVRHAFERKLNAMSKRLRKRETDATWIINTLRPELAEDEFYFGPRVH